jgi:hypothetical protein
MESYRDDVQSRKARAADAGQKRGKKGGRSAVAKELAEAAEERGTTGEDAAQPRGNGGGGAQSSGGSGGSRGKGKGTKGGGKGGKAKGFGKR